MTAKIQDPLTPTWPDACRADPSGPTLDVANRSGSKPSFLLGALALAGSLLAGHPLGAQVTSNVQSAARPFGLSIVDQVQTAGSDAASAQFQASFLPSSRTFLQNSLPEYMAYAAASQHTLDPAKLTMSVDSTARVYFVSEGAGYHNTLGFNTLTPGQTASGGLTNTAQLIFPDTSSSVSSYYTSSTPGARSMSEPLMPGDFVDLGKISAGSTLDFFLAANGAYGGQNIWTSSAARNPDQIQHVVAFALPNSPYLMISFEDFYGGGDHDFNDVVIAVEIGALNVQRLLSTPEPAAWLSLLILGLGADVWRRRRIAA